MLQKSILLGLLLFVFLSVPVVSAAEVIRIPQEEGLRLLCNERDWDGKGYDVGVLLPVKGALRAEKIHNAAIKLAWSQQGLLLRVRITDSTPFESDNVERLWAGDSLEVFIVFKKGEALERWQWVVTPFLDKKHNEAKCCCLHNNTTGKALPSIYPGLKITQDWLGNSCLMEICLPWSEIGFTPKLGEELSLQLYVNDYDGAGNHDRVLWYPAENTHSNPENAYRVQLSDQPSAPELLKVAASCDKELYELQLTAVASPESAGKTVTFLADDKPFGQAKLTRDNPKSQRSQATIFRPLPKYGQKAEAITVKLDDLPAVTPNTGCVSGAAEELVQTTDICAKGAVFTGATFPAIGFENPLLMRQVLGEYELKTTFYNEQYQIVTQAAGPGHYGAVVEIRPESGKPFRRFLTLLNTPSSFDNSLWLEGSFSARITLPASTGLPTDAAGRFPEETSWYIGHALRDSNRRSSDMAVWLAGLRTVVDKNLSNDYYNNPWILDRQWWLGLKGELYGWKKDWTAPFTAPRPLESEPAPVIREGTLAEAGVKPEGVNKLDSLLNTWAGDSDQPFAVCIVRNGVVVLHKAYGKLPDGSLMTVDTKRWMASISKLLAGTGLMLLVDQQKLALDDPAEQYLPPLRDLALNRPLLIRNLFNHTSGLTDHWGWWYSDMEERIAAILPATKINTRYEYNGTGLNLGGKIVEAVTGEAWPLFYNKHILQPLGCTHTEMPDNSAMAMSTPMDIAKIAQMLLNKGAYGKLRFMSEETFGKMLPRKLTEVNGPEYGVGTSSFANEGFGKGTFGHGAASAATLRIDPENRLIVVMTRNSAGKNFDKYHKSFLEAVANALEK